MKSFLLTRQIDNDNAQADRIVFEQYHFCSINLCPCTILLFFFGRFATLVKTLAGVPAL